MQLVTPSILYKDSFLDALKEYQKEKLDDRQDIFLINASFLKNNFQEYVDKLLDESSGKDLPRGYVPATTYWLIENDELIGRVNIRHSLTKGLFMIGGHIGYDIRPSKRRKGYGTKILEYALLKAKALGLTKVLVTCDETNIGSKKIIEANGGIFENSVSQGKERPRKLRYWITL